mmetsp:Transcript_107952/g.344163  ORF Transcript_107952/g.344163 Transcript_107952/m.344163 type:complete len:227 (-) Transcript_107952:7-687(-)
MESMSIYARLPTAREVLHGSSLHGMRIKDQVRDLLPEEAAPAMRLVDGVVDVVEARDNPLLRLPEHDHQVPPEGLVRGSEALVLQVVCQARAGAASEVLVEGHLLQVRMARAGAGEKPQAHQEGAAALGDVHVGEREHTAEPLTGVQPDQPAREARSAVPSAAGGGSRAEVPQHTVRCTLTVRCLGARGCAPSGHCQQWHQCPAPPRHLASGSDRGRQSGTWAETA